MTEECRMITSDKLKKLIDYVENTCVPHAKSTGSFAAESFDPEEWETILVGLRYAEDMHPGDPPQP